MHMQKNKYKLVKPGELGTVWMQDMWILDMEINKRHLKSSGSTEGLTKSSNRGQSNMYCKKRKKKRGMVR